MWDYAELSRMAKAMGGPEMLVKELNRRGFEKGFMQAKSKYEKFIWLAFAGGAAIVGILSWGVGKLPKKKRSSSEIDVATAEKIIIDGIKAYDESVADDPNAVQLPEMSKEEAEAKLDQLCQETADEINNEE